MGKTKRDTAASAEASFHKHCSAIWSETRWHESLYPALAAETRYALLVNQFAPSAALNGRLQVDGLTESLERLTLPTIDDQKQQGIRCLTAKRTSPRHEQSTRLPAPTAEPSGLATHWNLDAASVLVAHLLNVQPNESVLDLCAAPGGKFIALAQCIWPQLHEQSVQTNGMPKVSLTGHLCSNEADTARHRRLNENLRQYLPKQLFESKNVSTLQLDATDAMVANKLSIGTGGYDKVLVDAPCSSERHVIHAQHSAKSAGRSAPEMANWRPGSSKRLAETQLKLLISGIKATRIGGTIMYATCSIEPIENDGVIDKLLSWGQKEVKKGSKWTVTVGFNAGNGNEQLEGELERDWAERTKYGWIVLPDHPGGGGWGPLFFVLLTKVPVAG